MINVDKLGLAALLCIAPSCAAPLVRPIPTEPVASPPFGSESVEPEAQLTIDDRGYSRRVTDERVRRALREEEYISSPQYVFETMLGSRTFDAEEGWDPLERQVDIGVAFASPLLGVRTNDHSTFTDWLSWDLGARYVFDSSSRTAGTIESQIIEVSGGLLIEPPDPYARLRPYVGAGAAMSFTDFDSDIAGDMVNERDVITSPYVRAGLRFQFEPLRHFGFDVRWLDGADELVDGVGATLDSMTVSILFGARF